MDYRYLCTCGNFAIYSVAHNFQVDWFDDFGFSQSRISLLSLYGKHDVVHHNPVFFQFYACACILSHLAYFSQNTSYRMCITILLYFVTQTTRVGPWQWILGVTIIRYAFEVKNLQKPLTFECPSFSSIVKSSIFCNVELDEQISPVIEPLSQNR